MTKIHKANKILYYCKGYKNILCPCFVSYLQKISVLSSKLHPKLLPSIDERVRYYNQLSQKYHGTSFSSRVDDLKKPISPKSYFLDTYEYARHFPQKNKIAWEFGDVTHVPPVPSIVKSRPVIQNNQNSVLLKLDKARHFVFVKDSLPFEKKKNVLIGRAALHQEHRIRFYEQYFDHPLCDLGQINTQGGKPDLWLKPKISVQKHLQHKFVLSLQGHDVATNLKWIMSSNSIAVMPKPTMETWFMEGTLEGGRHYIEIADDYSDLEKQLNYYIQHPQKCLTIIENANAYCQQFMNKEVEDLCALLVLQKYFDEQY